MSDARMAVALLVMAGSGLVSAHAAAPQYRHQNRSITAATADEPLAEKFSSERLKDHLDTAVDLWAKQKQCISCHTHGIYLYVRPALSEWWGPPSDDVRKFLVEQVEERIEKGNDYGSAPAQLAYMSRGLAAWDAAFAKETSAETDRALRTLLTTMQAPDGSIAASYRFPPINSDTWHATAAAAIAAATAPGWQEQLEDGPVKEALEKLLGFLRDTPPEHDHQRLLLLWASAHWPGLIEEKVVGEIREKIWKQQRPEGGWSLRTFAEPEQQGNRARAEALRAEPDFDEPSSDGYQTALCIIVLRDSGVPAEDERIQKAANWLLQNQRESGRWWTKSLNTESRFHYISFSGTAYAALALARCGLMEGE